MFSHTTLLLTLATSASAHMIMNFPVPYGKATLNNSPLAPSDFPCKQRAGMYAVTEMNQWNAGETKAVSFMGTAVHGGGSCQFSITTDAEPTDKSQWKVIQSNIGGCPSGKYDGNVNATLPPGTDGAQYLDSSASLPVTMPADIPDGQYTFAWSWINKIGQREFYMNCAPVQIGSGKNTGSAAEALSDLPDMYVANLPSEECGTTEEEDFVYPDPGENVVMGTSAAKYNPGNKMTGTGCVKQNAMGAGAGQIGSPSAGSPSLPSAGSPSSPSVGTPSVPAGTPSSPSYSTPSQASGAPSQPQVSQKPVASSAPSYNAPNSSKLPSNPGGGLFAPGASSAPAAQPTAPTVQKPAPSTPSSPAGENNTTPIDGECTPCTNDGGVVCIGSNQFGLCNRGCAVAQDLAAGMACSNGVVVAAAKRHVHFPRAHLHRRFSASHLL